MPTDSAAFSVLGILRQAMTMCQPLSAIDLADHKPTPEDAPVIITVGA